MTLFRFLVAITGLFGFGHQLIFAFPAIPPNPLVARDVPCDDISMYTTQFFLDNAINQPAENGLFYTAEWMNSALNLTRSEGNPLITLWDIWDCKYYNKNVNDVNNPLRCIFNDPKMTRTYFENMSRAFAMLCNSMAYIMADDPSNIPQGGVWSEVEYPTLKQTGNPGGQVDFIYAIDPQGNSETEIWERDDDAVTGFNTVTKRDGDSDYCYTTEQLVDWFGGIDW